MRSLRAPEMRPGRTEVAGTIAGDTDGQGRGGEDEDGDSVALLARPEIRVCLPTGDGDERLESPPRRGETLLPFDGIIRTQLFVFDPGAYEIALIPAAVWDRTSQQDRPDGARRVVMGNDTVAWLHCVAVGPLPADMQQRPAKD